MHTTTHTYKGARSRRNRVGLQLRSQSQNQLNSKMNKKPTQQRTPIPPTQHPRRNLASKQEAKEKRLQKKVPTLLQGNRAQTREEKRISKKGSNSKAQQTTKRRQHLHKHQRLRVLPRQQETLHKKIWEEGKDSRQKDRNKWKTKRISSPCCC